ncbi:electron transport complex subunit RsxG [Ectothiorhodospiraceae bacterium BW-2]|nr:electron transport complex subunit RsxG [Ectothiorhodospiraceae bacterium BW-2]
MLINATILGLFAILGTSLVSSIHESTAPLIAENEYQTILNNLTQIIPPERYDNAIVEDKIEVVDPLLGNQAPKQIYRARYSGRAVAVVIESVAPDGYSGDIGLLIGIDIEGNLLGVRVIYHKETPGLGDKIEATRSDWILGFNQLNLTNPPQALWQVKKEGGVFDQFTGATITPRAVVNAIKNSLLFYQQQRQALFRPITSSE